MSHTVTAKTVPQRDVAAMFSAEAELKARGVNVELERDAVPRMYYANQLQKHLGRENEVCDFVLRVKDAYYDVGFIKQEDGSYSPVFDDYNYHSSTVPETKTGKGPIRDFIGAKFDGKVEHWSGQRDDTEQTLHSIGGFLKLYSKHAAINAATSQGYVVESTTENADGSINLVIGV